MQSNLAPNTGCSNYAIVFCSNGYNKSLIDIKCTFANPPTNLIINAVDNNNVTLEWTNGSGGNYRYAVERAIDTGSGPSNWTYIIQWTNNLTTTIYTDQNLIGETKYWYRVRGYNGDAIITTPSNLTNVNIIVPTSPTNFKGIAFTNKIVWTWTDIAATETNNMIFNQNNSNLSGLLGTNASVWTQNNLLINTWYTNYIYTVNQFGNIKSQYEGVCTLGLAPVNLIGNAIDGTTISLTWTNVNATAYSVERAGDINGTPGAWQVIVNFANNLTTPSYTDNNLTPNTYYWYRIKSYNQQGVANPQPSNEVKIKTAIAGNLEEVVAVPNPYKINTGEQYITFFNITKNVKIKIYTVDGKLLATIEDNSGKGYYDWDLKDDTGEYLDSGVYICHLSNDEGQNKVLKIVIVR